MVVAGWVVCLLIALLLGLAPAQAERRIALVIGNGAYKHAPRLDNPTNDATDVSAALKRAGFETIIGLNLDKTGMEDATIHFSRAARQADVAMVYYSGHAMQFNGINYLLPVDAELKDEADLRRLVRVDQIVADLQQARNLRILVLDACRDNPLAEALKRSMGSSPRSALIERGIKRIENVHGMIVAYATQAGATAEDGIGRNSPYTAAFLRHIEEPEEIATVFRQISADVYRATGQRQLPELSLSFLGEFYLRGRPGSAPAPSQGTAFKDCDGCPEVVVVPAGQFTMGSPDSEPGRLDIEGPQRIVTIPSAFAVGKYAITRDQFEAFVKATGYLYSDGCHAELAGKWVLRKELTFRTPGFPQDGRHPVVCISWNDAKAYAKWLSAQTGKTYRLLTEAEREYVSRAGTSTAYWWGATVSPDLANYDKREPGAREPVVDKAGATKVAIAAKRTPANANEAAATLGPPRGGTVPVYLYQPNPWGLYQVHGNVAEWVEDCWNKSFMDAPSDSSAVQTGDCGRRVLRGGAWSYWPSDIRAAYRESARSDQRYVHVGFRVARDLQ